MHAVRDQSVRQNMDRLFAGNGRAFRDLLRSTASERMLENGERIVRQAHHAGDVARGDLERHGAKHHGPFAGLLEGDAVMQTARRATASVTRRSDQVVAFRRKVGQ